MCVYIYIDGFIHTVLFVYRYMYLSPTYTYNKTRQRRSKYSFPEAGNCWDSIEKFKYFLLRAMHVSVSSIRYKVYDENR